MNFDFPCTHPDNWPCKESNVNPGRCGTQEIHHAARGCIEGHYALNADGDGLKTRWTGNSQQVTLDVEEQKRWAFRSFGDDEEHDDWEAFEFWRANQHRAPNDDDEQDA